MPTHIDLSHHLRVPFPPTGLGRHPDPGQKFSNLWEGDAIGAHFHDGFDHLDTNQENEVAGIINFNEITRGAFQACYMGYDLSGRYEGQGLMTEGLRAAIDYAFSMLNLHRIMANYQPYNTRSGNVLKRLGFVIEGTVKDYLFLKGEWKDHVLTSLINHQWKAP